MKQPMKIEKARKLILIVTVVVILVFLGSLGWGLYQYTWVETSGTVTQSLSFHDFKENTYDNTVRYVYTVNGDEYSGSYTDLNEISAQSYQEGSSIKVYYNPVYPAMSTIFQGQILSILVQMFCCIVPFLVIINGMLYLPKPKNEPPLPTKGMVYNAQEDKLEKRE